MQAFYSDFLANMAESQEGEQFRSKIPRYVRTEIPVCSVAYKETLRKVSEVKTKVEEKRQVIGILKDDMEVRRRSAFGVVGESRLPRVQSPKMLSTGSTVTSRKVIYTPGGTKRKGIRLLARAFHFLYYKYYDMATEFFCIIAVTQWLFVLEQYAEFGLLFVLQWEYFLQLSEIFMTRVEWEIYC